MHRKLSVFAARRGMTLVEALVAIAIIAFAAALAWPPLAEHLRKGHRLEAIAALEGIRVAQERYRATNHRYAAGLVQLGRAADEVDAAGGRYRVMLEAVDEPATAFRLVARPLDAGDRCGVLVLTEAGPDRAASGAPDCWPR